MVGCLFLLSVLINILPVPAWTAERDHKTIMILYSVGREFRPWDEWARTIRSALDRQSPWPLDVQEYSLVKARTDAVNPEIPFLEYLQVLYKDHPPDLIICVGAPAASFMQRHRQQLFPGAPVLFTSLKSRRIQYSSMTDNDTVVAVTHRFDALFESFLKILPETKTIAIVNGASPGERFWRDEMIRELRPLEGKVEIRWYDKLSYEDALKQLAALPEHAAIFWYQMVVDAAGIAHEGDRALSKLFAAANAPIFTHDDSFFGKKIIGGPMHSARVAAAPPLRLPFVFSTAKNLAISRRRLANLWRLDTIGENCGAGGSTNAFCLLAAPSIFVSLLPGRSIVGRSHWSARSC